ncbi:hypothetical protein [Streptomyces sp. NPDC015350]|uniref:hypothetical protein n=1 Tax=Streptomyces sp. NPDC015350 TaxID=3364955 RepID=UPI0036FB7866
MRRPLGLPGAPLRGGASGVSNCSTRATGTGCTAQRWHGGSAAGGSFTPDAWLMDVCSALLHGRPKTALHCCDMALSTWVERPGDRAVLRFVRGLLIADHVKDPLRALEDLESALHGPNWLAERAAPELERVTAEANRSRIRKPRATPAPELGTAYRDLTRSQTSDPAPSPTEPLPPDGAVPSLWDPAMSRLRQP